MNILVFNAGSASLKFEVIATPEPPKVSDQQRKLVSGGVEGIGEEATFSLLENKQTIQKEKIDASDYGEATRHVLKWLDAGRWQDASTTNRLEAAGHRIVHGGDRFTKPVVIDTDVIAGIEELEDLAPLHNAPALESIRTSRDVLGSDVPMIAVFDTVFHRTIPKRARMYALPWELARRNHIQRYGFHGISHEYLVRRYAQITNTPIEKVTVITLHLESGCSACAVRNGQSVDTSMGFTPLEGLMMGMRSGDIDPSIVGYLVRKERVSVEKVEEWLNKESGLLGISGRSLDTRELMRLIDTDDRARLSLEIFCYRIRKYIGAYLAALGGAQAIIFGGGIGEDTPFVRARVLEEFDWFGLTLDPTRNEQTINREGRITTDGSRLHAYVIPVEEGLLIADQTIQCLKAS
jgi:acetate kinase